MMNESLAPTSLQDRQAFPSFEECPHRDGVPETYYSDKEDGVYRPIRHWCFLGEITDKLVFNRLCLTVKDRRGQEVPANFHLDQWRSIYENLHTWNVQLPRPSQYAQSLTEKGNTMAILYAQQHNFMDGTIGFRIEDADQVQVRPILLEENLLKERPT
jgi:hypothetical protein